ncbi:MAG: adenylate/guanylate cyclase domain-containing protein [Beijerinckiaceae bacterium]
MQIQADALATLVSNALPRRPSWVSKAEIFGTVALCLAAIVLAMFLRPMAAAALAGLLCSMWVAGAAIWFMREQFLIDMAGPPSIVIIVFAATALGSYAQNERLVRALRRRFEQHLAADVVKKLVDAPNVLRLGGESREVTAMFTDIEGFTSLTDRSEASEVLRLLDEYLTIVTDTILAHGGMVDKLIGDGVFALFNAPLDLADHPRQAVAAAKAIVAATERFRKTPLALKLALGRTRIGIETGPAIVGDVGGTSKLDYTALGSVVNTASRLEGINKAFKTAICIGPIAASKLGAHETVRLGAIQVRGRSSEMKVFTVAGSHEQKEPPATVQPNKDTSNKAD